MPTSDLSAPDKHQGIGCPCRRLDYPRLSRGVLPSRSNGGCGEDLECDGRKVNDAMRPSNTKTGHEFDLSDSGVVMCPYRQDQPSPMRCDGAVGVVGAADRRQRCCCDGALELSGRQSWVS